MGKFLHSNHVMGTENMEILKVVIADDEVRICQLIQALIDWDSMGMKVVGIAHNGEEACEMVRQTQPDILILDEPTRGIDVGAKYSIYEIMNDLACKGYGIIMVSSEMPEVLGVADRVVVMKSGRVTGEFSEMDTVTQEMLLEASLKEREGHK